mmetsp:Transcript_96583/g.273041  ORF Transcript_96583/g.273041 Transcript_96583/m.273041 type:complete len:315 (-) Transcript_96583:33-977(-)
MADEFHVGEGTPPLGVLPITHIGDQRRARGPRALQHAVFVFLPLALDRMDQHAREGGWSLAHFLWRELRVEGSQGIDQIGIRLAIMRLVQDLSDNEGYHELQIFWASDDNSLKPFDDTAHILWTDHVEELLDGPGNLGLVRLRLLGFIAALGRLEASVARRSCISTCQRPHARVEDPLFLLRITRTFRGCWLPPPGRRPVRVLLLMLLLVVARHRRRPPDEVKAAEFCTRCLALSSPRSKHAKQQRPVIGLRVARLLNGAPHTVLQTCEGTGSDTIPMPSDDLFFVCGGAKLFFATPRWAPGFASLRRQCRPDK